MKFNKNAESNERLIPKPEGLVIGNLQILWFSSSSSICHVCKPEIIQKVQAQIIDVDSSIQINVEG